MTDVSQTRALDPLASKLIGLVKSMPLGSKFPSERDLEREWGVSRPALRTRLRTLESVGLIERRGTGGSFTRTMQPEDISDAMRIGLSGLNLDDEISFRPVRTALERQAALAAARRQDEDALAKLRAALDWMHAAGVPAEVTRADLAFHAALFEASGEPSLRFMYGAMRGLMDDSVARRRDQLAHSPAGLEESFRLHTEVFAAVKSGDEQRSMRSVDALIAQDIDNH